MKKNKKKRSSKVKSARPTNTKYNRADIDKIYGDLVAEWAQNDTVVRMQDSSVIFLNNQTIFAFYMGKWETPLNKSTISKHKNSIPIKLSINNPNRTEPLTEIELDLRQAELDFSIKEAEKHLAEKNRTSRHGKN